MGSLQHDTHHITLPIVVNGHDRATSTCQIGRACANSNVIWSGHGFVLSWRGKWVIYFSY